MPNAISNKNILHVGSSSSLVVTSAMEAVGDKCKTRRHDVDFKQWIQYYDAYSVKRSSSRRVLLYVYAVCSQSLYLWSSVCTFCSLMNYFHALHVCLCWFFLFALLRYVPNVLYFKRMWRCILIFLKWIKYHDVKERRLFVWCIISAPMIFNAHLHWFQMCQKKQMKICFIICSPYYITVSKKQKLLYVYLFHLKYLRCWLRRTMLNTQSMCFWTMRCNLLLKRQLIFDVSLRIATIAVTQAVYCCLLWFLVVHLTYHN